MPDKAILTTKMTAATTWSLSFSTIFAITHELQSAITILWVMIMIDFFTWFIKSWVMRETSSNWIARGFMRKATLILIPLTLIIAWRWVNVDLTELSTWIVSALVFSELYSIIANVYTINTWKKAKEYDVMTMIIKRLWNFIDFVLIWKKDND